MVLSKDVTASVKSSQGCASLGVTHNATYAMSTKYQDTWTLRCWKCCQNLTSSWTKNKDSTKHKKRACEQWIVVSTSSLKHLQLLKSWKCKFMGNHQLWLNFLKAIHWYKSENFLCSNPEVLGRGLGTVCNCRSPNFKTTRRSAHIRFSYQRLLPWQSQRFTQPHIGNSQKHHDNETNLHC